MNKNLFIDINLLNKNLIVNKHKNCFFCQEPYIKQLNITEPSGGSFYDGYSSSGFISLYQSTISSTTIYPWHGTTSSLYKSYSKEKYCISIKCQSCGFRLLSNNVDADNIHNSDKIDFVELKFNYTNQRITCFFETYNDANEQDEYDPEALENLKTSFIYIDDKYDNSSHLKNIKLGNDLKLFKRKITSYLNFK